MHIEIKLGSSSPSAQRRARHLADAIWALPRATDATCVIMELSDGRRFCVVGKPPAEPTAPYCLVGCECERCRPDLYVTPSSSRWRR
jgi:hypothetical protein